MRITKIRLLVGILILCFCSSCKNEKKEAVELMMHKKVQLSLENMECLHSAEDTLQVNTQKYYKYTFVHFVDSSQCSPCALDKMYLWNDLIAEFDKANVRSVFIFEPKKNLLEDILFSVESSGLKKPIYLDSAYLFRQENKFVPQDILYHSFMLDDKGKIVLVGNPLLNKRVEKLFKRIIKK